MVRKGLALSVKALCKETVSKSVGANENARCEYEKNM